MNRAPDIKYQYQYQYQYQGFCISCDSRLHSSRLTFSSTGMLYSYWCRLRFWLIPTDTGWYWLSPSLIRVFALPVLVGVRRRKREPRSRVLGVGCWELGEQSGVRRGGCADVREGTGKGSESQKSRSCNQLAGR